MNRTVLERFRVRSVRVAAHAGFRLLDAFSFGVAGSVIGEVMRPPIDQRLAKIEEAKQNLAEALTAIEDLQAEAQTNSRALSQLTDKLDKAEERKTLIQRDIDTLRELSKLDAESMRTGLGIPNRLQVWFERILSFLIGVAASVVASWIWTTFSS